MSEGPPSGNRISVDVLALVRLLQLASPALPVGAYSYSQGLEWAIERRIVHDAASAQQWIGDVLAFVMADGEAAILWRLLDARAGCDATRFVQWSAWFVASRESRELRAETEQMGASLLRLVSALGVLDAVSKAIAREASSIPLPAAYALAAHALAVPAVPALAGYLMSWLENQMLVAVKALPLGQLAGQRLLHALAARIPKVVDRAQAIPDDDIVSFAPGYAFASIRHEAQYSRLFRS